MSIFKNKWKNKSIIFNNGLGDGRFVSTFLLLSPLLLQQHVQQLQPPPAQHHETVLLEQSLPTSKELRDEEAMPVLTAIQLAYLHQLHHILLFILFLAGEVTLEESLDYLFIIFLH